MTNKLRNLLRLLPHPQDIMADQQWEQPTDLVQAKNLLGRLRSSITRRARNAFFHPHDKIQSVLMFTHTIWSKLEQEIVDDLITHGRNDATHWCLRHNRDGINEMSDKALIHRKKADGTIARVQIKSRHSMDVKGAALLLWINQFLPKYNKDIFNEEELQRLRNRV